MPVSDIIALVSSLAFGKMLWEPMQFLFDKNGNFLYTDIIRGMCNIGLMLLAICMALEIVRQYRNGLEGKQILAPRFIVYSIVLIILLSSATVYTTFTKTAISIAELIQKNIMNDSIDFLEFQLHNLHKAYAESSKSLFSWVTASLEIFTPLGLLSAIAIWVALGILYAIPLIQGIYIAVYFLLGPLLIPFAIFEPTRKVALFWMEQMLGAIFIGVVLIITYSCISVSGIVENLADAKSNQILTLFYSLVTIGVLVSSVFIAFSLFNTANISLGKSFKAAKKYMGLGIV